MVKIFKVTKYEFFEKGLRFDVISSIPCPLLSGPQLAKRVFGHMRQREPRSACTFAQSDQGLHCLLIESLDTTESMERKGPDDILRMRWMI